MLTTKVKHEIHCLVEASYSNLFSRFGEKTLEKSLEALKQHYRIWSDPMIDTYFYQQYTNTVCNALNINQVRFEPWMLLIFKYCHRFSESGYTYRPTFQSTDRIALRRDALIVFQKRVVYGDVKAYDDFCIKLDAMEGV